MYSRYSSTQVLRYLGTQILRYSRTWVFVYLGTWVLKYLGTQVLGYSGTRVLRYWGTQVLGYSGTSVLYRPHCARHWVGPEGLYEVLGEEQLDSFRAALGDRDTIHCTGEVHHSRRHVQL